MGRYFGTDGVRGVANLELTAELAFKLGRAGAYVLSSENKHSARILVGMDTRISGDMLECALVAGICSVGADAICVGVIPTPAVAYLTRLYAADAGIVISASHNSFEYNGIKFFNNKGYKLSDETESKIESVLSGDSDLITNPTGKYVGRKILREAASDDYIKFAKSTINSDLKGMKIAVDCANGAAYKIAPEALSELGAEIVVINDKPDGININESCGSTNLKELQDCVRQNKSDVGIAFDGDADRLLAVDENGDIIDGDKLMAIIGIDLKREGKLAKDTIVATVMSNLGFDIMARNEGLNIVKTTVGDRFVLEEMIKSGFVLGGEQSGHIIFTDHNTTGDGLITALKFLSTIRKSGKKPSELASVMSVLPQVLKNAKVKSGNEKRYLEDEMIAKMCENLETEFHGEGRVLIRPSGTEPLVRVMIEGKNLDYITERALELVMLIEEKFR